MNTPQVSIVIAGRNDNYGTNFLQRLDTFVRSLDWQCKPYPGRFELVVVEWNPLSDRDPLSKVIRPTKNLATRVITVPPDVHTSLGAPYPVLEFYAKNVGARRARGEFVLTTNPDILFSNELITELATGWLRKDCVYRTDRFDFRCDGIEDVADSDLLAFAVQNTFCGHVMDNNASMTVDVANVDHAGRLPRTKVTDATVHTNACGDFILASREAFFTARGLWETTEQRWHVDSTSLVRFLNTGLHQAFFVAPHCIFHQDHARSTQDCAFEISDIGKKPGSPNWGLNNIALTEIELV